MSSIKLIVTLALITTLSLLSVGCSSDDSPTSIVDPPVIDTAPPAVPANVDAAYSNGQVTLSWDQNSTDADLAGFVVDRVNNGVTTSLVASPTMLQNFQDSPALGLNVYQVYSVDLTGNASAIATAEYHLAGQRPVEDDLHEY